MNETLETWVRYGWLTRHETSRQEILALLAVADRDLTTAQLPDVPPDWRLNIAYNAALQSAAIALAAAGYRAEKESHHYRLLQSLAVTIGLDAASVDQLDKLRKKRNVSSYSRAGLTSEREAQGMIALAQKVREAVEHWLVENRPDLLEA